MLREAFEYLMTPCPPLGRRYGYLAEAVALGARHRRQRRAWAPHVEACRRFVREAAGQAPRGGRALVAGSGLLIEVPLPLLAERFDEVVMIDMVHTHAARRQARRHPNVRLLTLDVTGALAPLDTALSEGSPLPSPSPPNLPGERFAFAVSCNLLSQLPLLPLNAIDRKAPNTPEAEQERFARALAQTHRSWLSRVAEQAALFTDVESLWLENGAVQEREDSLWGLELPHPDRAWDWDIAPAPEEDRRRSLRHRVGAWFNLSAPTGT
ncbi:hypothetical protein D3869_00325 [Azospirillum brasilense]|uniref:Class I SAM-dependent methyltransferase n=1 Tax=Azospirillum brasilense TaxID=192 RepID=A0A4D8QSF2_AZOBR|nr:hypothetical protein [Azospirillum brasilense]QCO13805.1 hypothetical protein D3869_00325 [Azospirillum brasilense]